jgi:hypothetical protein
MASFYADIVAYAQAGKARILGSPYEAVSNSDQTGARNDLESPPAALSTAEHHLTPRVVVSLLIGIFVGTAVATFAHRRFFTRELLALPSNANTCFSIFLWFANAVSMSHSEKLGTHSRASFIGSLPSRVLALRFEPAGSSLDGKR